MALAPTVVAALQAVASAQTQLRAAASRTANTGSQRSALSSAANGLDAVVVKLNAEKSCPEK